MSGLADNLVHFAQLLRRAGIAVGTGQVIDATAALAAVGVDRRDEVFWALHATLIRRREDFELFERAFELFFRDPTALNRSLALLLPITTVPAEPGDRSRRVDEARRRGRAADRPRPEPERREVDMAMTWSSIEVDRRLDFEQMSAAELAAAERAIARIGLIWAGVDTRRHRADRRGPRFDGRATLRAALRTPDVIDLRRASPRRRRRPLVILADVSGSMERYSRLFLRFAHAVASARPRVFTFTFGTELCNVTRALRHRDIDLALAAIADQVTGAGGGTRIGRCLHRFNRDWSRRVLGGGARVLLMTDGLERDSDHDLGFETERLARSCRRLIWLNPLLRWAGFEPKAAGIVAILPHVDELRPVHDLASIEQLAAALG
jgi:hypothetical protein